MFITSILFGLFTCSRLKGPADVIRLAEIAVSQGLVLGHEYVRMPDGLAGVIPFRGEIQELVSKVFKDREYVDAPRLINCMGPFFSFGALIELKQNGRSPVKSNAVSIRVEGHLTSHRYNYVAASASYYESKDTHTESVVSSLVRLAKAFYGSLQPSFGWLDYSGNKVLEMEYIQSGKKLSTISWANFWGADYVEKFGKEYLLNSPGWKTEELVDGGVYHQVSESFKKPISLDLKNELASYFGQAGVKYILGKHPHG